MKRVIVVGLDGFEPRLAERLVESGELPHLRRLRDTGGYGRLATTLPAQTPVAWSTLAVGRNPGGHGIFDFLRRDPDSLRPDIALHTHEQKSTLLPPRAVNRRRGTPLWEILGDAGVRSVVLRHPCTYPPDKIRGRMLSGVAVPDLRGGFGTATVYTDERGARAGEGERVVAMGRGPDGSARSFLPGPLLPGGEEARIELEVVGSSAGDGVAVRLEGAGEVEVPEGGWSGWLRVKFKLGALHSRRGQVRFHLAHAADPLVLYASPVQFDPDAPCFPISHPWDYAGELRRHLGAYHTLGMAEETGGLENGRFDEDAFLRQCQEVLGERRAMLRYELDRFDEGLLFCVFDTPDRIQHMFWRFREADHPANAEHGHDPRWERVIEDHYRVCDEAVGEALEAADGDTLVLVVSDHGFRGFRREVHLNRWLHREGLLALREDASPGAAGDLLEGVDWERTRAYALGLAGVYLNVRGREARGVVDPGEAGDLARRLAAGLTGLSDPERGAVAVRSARVREDVYRGPYVDEAPDVVVGCADGYRVSAATALGGVPEATFSDNRKRWSGDHVMDPELVPGVLYASVPLAAGPADLVDVAPTILAALGVPVSDDMEGRSLLP
ncbi:MAG: alkaline phosphatase family protein [Gemmatimonadetes bacterium]|nr:alkaline phosphatase family protein [Gemmatimonadota bacterium]